MNGWQIFAAAIIILGFLTLLRFAFSGFLDKKEEGMMPHCPKCRTPLEYLGADTITDDSVRFSYGNIAYYECPDCSAFWKNWEGSQIDDDSFNPQESSLEEVNLIRGHLKK